VWERLRTLHRLGRTVDLLATVKAPPSADAVAAVRELTRNCWWVPRTRRWGDHFHLDPFQAVSRRALVRAELSESYEWTILEGDCMAGVLDNPRLRTRRVAWRVNNDEPGYFWQLARAAKGPASAYYALEAVKFAAWTARLRRQAGWQVWFAADGEQRRFAARGAAFAARSRWLPSPMPLDNVAAPHAGAGGALFVGSLFMPNNRAAVDWFLRRVHPKMQLPGYSLTVAGNVRGGEIEALRRRIAMTPNARLVASPDEAQLRALYAQSRVFVNPMRQGGGIALKTPHALLAGLPVVTTTLGARGSGLQDQEHLEVADAPAEFAARVARVWANPSAAMAQVARAQAFIRHSFDHDRLLAEALAPLPAPMAGA
jgi:hypothetical protein